MTEDEKAELLQLSAGRLAAEVVALCEENAAKPVWHWQPDARDHLKLARALLASQTENMRLGQEVAAAKEHMARLVELSKPR